MMTFVDIHGHYAWNVDDGIRSREEAEKALKSAKEANIDTIVATPHIIPGRQTLKDINRIKDRINELKVLANKYNIAVYEGCELFLNEDTVSALNEGVYIPIEKTKYLLCEFDVRHELDDDERKVEERLHEIRVRGYIPLIAHVERYFHGKIDIDRVQYFIDNGCAIQLNASSLIGIMGKHAKQNALILIDEGMAHVISTDTHRASGGRTPATMCNCYQELEKEYSEEILQLLMHDNAMHIISDEPVEFIEPTKRSFLSKLLKRR